jgi:hypothetical protein
MLNTFGIFGLGFLAGSIIIAVLVIIFVFELIMFINAIRNPVMTNTTKALWLVGMLLIHPFVAIAYYFTDYKRQ